MENDALLEFEKRLAQIIPLTEDELQIKVEELRKNENEALTVDEERKKNYREYQEREEEEKRKITEELRQMEAEILSDMNPKLPLRRFAKKESGVENFPVAERFGALVTKELWGVVPFALYKYQKLLDLSIAEVWFLAWLFMHQWNTDDSFPSLNALSRYTGKTRTYIQTIAHGLHDKGLLIIKRRKLNNGATASNFYDTEPLLKRLGEIIKEDTRSRHNS